MNRQPSLGIGIKRYYLQRLDEGNIETVDPDHVLVAFMRVFMPGALRRQNQISIFHDHLLAIDVGVSAMAVQDKSKCGHRMPVCRRDFAGLNELKRKKDCVAGHLGFR